MSNHLCFKPIRASVFNYCLVILQWTALWNCPSRSINIEVRPTSTFRLRRSRVCSLAKLHLPLGNTYVWLTDWATIHPLAGWGKQSPCQSEISSYKCCEFGTWFPFDPISTRQNIFVIDLIFLIRKHCIWVRYLILSHWRWYSIHFQF